jgi:hypothetical protein
VSRLAGAEPCREPLTTGRRRLNRRQVFAAAVTSLNTINFAVVAGLLLLTPLMTKIQSWCSSRKRSRGDPHGWGWLLPGVA